MRAKPCERCGGEIWLDYSADVGEGGERDGAGESHCVFCGRARYESPPDVIERLDSWRREMAADAEARAATAARADAARTARRMESRRERERRERRQLIARSLLEYGASVGEVADALRLPYQTVYGWRRNGEI